jgi:hypothetical protein
VHAFLSELHCTIDESHILTKSYTLLLLRFLQETSPLGYVKDAEGYIEDTKTAAQAKKGYAHKTQGYTAEASTSHPSMYHLGKRRETRHTCVEASWSQDSNPTNGTPFHLFDFRARSNGHFTEDCTEGEKMRENWRPLRECFNQLAFHLPTWLLQFTPIPHPSRRVVPSIYTPYVPQRTQFWLLRIDNHIWFSYSRAAECLAHPSSSLFFLDLWRDPYGFRYFVLYWFQLCCTVLCGSVPACGSAVVLRSSRSLHGSSDFSPTLGRIQPLSGIKHLPTACSNLSCYETYCREDRAIPRIFLAMVPITNIPHPPLRLRASNSLQRRMATPLRSEYSATNISHHLPETCLIVSVHFFSLKWQWGAHARLRLRLCFLPSFCPPSWHVAIEAVVISFLLLRLYVLSVLACSCKRSNSNFVLSSLNKKCVLHVSKKMAVTAENIYMLLHFLSFLIRTQELQMHICVYLWLGHSACCQYQPDNPHYHYLIPYMLNVTCCIMRTEENLVHGEAGVIHSRRLPSSSFTQVMALECGIMHGME